MAFSKERVNRAYHYWRMLPLWDRSQRELENCLKRHGLVDIDAKAYARNLIKNDPTLERLDLGLRPLFKIKGEGPAAVPPATDTGNTGK